MIHEISNTGGYHNGCEFIPGLPASFQPRPVQRGYSLDITDWRRKIDELDEQIVHLISQRAFAAKQIGELKHKISLPIYEPQREQAVFDHVRAANPGPLADVEMLHVYERIMDVMRTLQRHDS